MKNLSEKEHEALKIIRNSIIHNGSKPTYKKLMELLIYQSPRSINIIIRSLIEKEYLAYDEFGKLKVNNFPEVIINTTVNVPILGQIACGSPNFAEENFEDVVSVSTTLAKPPHAYFILRARGDSMDGRHIYDGNLVLIRKQPTANNGEVTACLINNECTLKEFYKSDEYIILKPNSSNNQHKPIILTCDFTILGVMVKVLPEI